MSDILSLSIFLKKIFIIAVGIFGIGFLIGFHELGHFLFAKLFNVKVPSFSIGFGPTLLKKKIGETTFSISAIPLGGYVEMAGSPEVGQGEQKEAHRRDDRSLASKPYWQKMCIILGGILFNLIFAYLVFIALAMAGLPKTRALPIIEAVQEGGPAKAADLCPGDLICFINGVQVNNIEEDAFKPRFLQEIISSPGKTINLTIERDGQRKDIQVTLGSTTLFGQEKGTIGVFFKTVDMPRMSFVQAVKTGIWLTNRNIVGTIKAFKHIFSKGDVSMMGGPLLIISETIKSAHHGLKMFLLFLAIISINLAILNLIPLPILDGGKMLYYTIEAVTGRPLSERVQQIIDIATVVLLLGLIAYLTVKDIGRIGIIQRVKTYLKR